MILRFCYLSALLFFLVSCGIEDGFSFNPPVGLYATGTDGLELRFTAYNQEKGTNGKYLIMGYDIYYSFPSLPNEVPRKAMVKKPDITSNLELLNIMTLYSSFYNNTYFLNKDLTDKQIYQFVTIPVMNVSGKEWITNILKDGKPDNVRFRIDDSGWNTVSPLNPYSDNDDCIFLSRIYPEYNEYKDQIWGGGAAASPAGREFKGFLDKDFYEYRSSKVTPDSTVTDHTYYLVTFYVVAKGFSDDDDESITVGNVKTSEVSNKYTLKIKVPDNSLDN